MSTAKSESFLHELNAEYRATRLCLERIPESLFQWKPHEAEVEHEGNAVTKDCCEDYKFRVSVSHAKTNHRKVDL